MAGRPAGRAGQVPGARPAGELPREPRASLSHHLSRPRPPQRPRGMNASGSSEKTSTRTVVAPSATGPSNAVPVASCKKKGAPSIVNPATPPRFHSSVAPRARWDQSAAAGADGTASMSMPAVIRDPFLPAGAEHICRRAWALAARSPSRPAARRDCRVVGQRSRSHAGLLAANLTTSLPMPGLTRIVVVRSPASSASSWPGPSSLVSWPTPKRSSRTGAVSSRS